jgi:hypothetical protein
MLSSCGGSGAGPAVVNSAVSFDGLQSLERLGDGRIQLRWKFVEQSVMYGVFVRKDNEEFDWSAPIELTANDYFFYEQENIFEVARTCFAVRVFANESDKNSVEHCSDGVILDFQGIDELNVDESGVIVAKWQALNIKNISYKLFVRQIPEEFNWESPSIAPIENAFLQLDTPVRGVQSCYAVRYMHSILPSDENTNEICGPLDDLILFNGVGSLSQLSSTEVQIDWTPSLTEDVTGYVIYLGSDYSEKAMEVRGRTESKAVIDGLVRDRQYSIGVRAVDTFGREDTNLKILSIVLN